MNQSAWYGKIGLTTTVPVEIIYAARWLPVDLNNIFISGEKPGDAVDRAERAGYPRNICGWIKGLYTTLLDKPEIKKVIAVTQGDCSNTHALMETWQMAGIEVIPFAFPYDRDYDLLKLQMEKLMSALKCNWEEVYLWKNKLDLIRRKALLIDEMTWRYNTVSGMDNHLALVGCSDFNSDPDEYEQYLDKLLAEAEGLRQEIDPQGDAVNTKKQVRLGYIGVPPIMTDLYSYLEEAGAKVLFNEVQRQFAMPFGVEDLVEQYRIYTYPYSVFGRIEDIKSEIEARNLDGIIHYTQSFCFRQIEDLILRKQLTVPILTLEGDRPGELDARSRMRIDAFVDMLQN